MHIKFDKKSDAVFNKFCWHSLFDISIKSNYAQNNENFIPSCKLSMCQQTRYSLIGENIIRNPLAIKAAPDQK